MPPPSSALDLRLHEAAKRSLQSTTDDPTLSLVHPCMCRTPTRLSSRAAAVGAPLLRLHFLGVCAEDDAVKGARGGRSRRSVRIQHHGHAVGVPIILTTANSREVNSTLYRNTGLWFTSTTTSLRRTWNPTRSSRPGAWGRHATFLKAPFDPSQKAPSTGPQAPPRRRVSGGDPSG